MFSAMDVDKELHLSSCVCGYHIYNAIWSVTVGEELQYAIEIENAKDGYTKYLHFMRFKCSGVWGTYLKKFLELTQAVAGISHDTFNHVTNITLIYFLRKNPITK